MNSTCRFKKLRWVFSVKNTYINFEYNGHVHKQSVFSSAICAKPSILAICSSRFCALVAGTKSLLANFRQSYDGMQRALAQVNSKHSRDYLGSRWLWRVVFKTNYPVCRWYLRYGRWEWMTRKALLFPYNARFLDNRRSAARRGRSPAVVHLGRRLKDNTCANRLNPLVRAAAMASTTHSAIGTRIAGMALAVNLFYIKVSLSNRSVCGDVVFACHCR